MGTIMSRRVKRRAGYGVYVPAKSSHAPPYDSGQPSEAPGIQQRPVLRVSAALGYSCTKSNPLQFGGLKA